MLVIDGVQKYKNPKTAGIVFFYRVQLFATSRKTFQALYILGIVRVLIQEYPLVTTSKTRPPLYLIAKSTKL